MAGTHAEMLEAWHDLSSDHRNTSGRFDPVAWSGSLWVYKSAPEDGVCQPNCSSLLSLTGRALGLASVVSITARGHIRLVGTQLSKGGGIG